MIPNVMLPQSQLPAKVRRSDPSNSAEIAPQGRDECRNECEDNVNVIQQHESAPAFLPRETYCNVPACPDRSTAPPATSCAARDCLLPLSGSCRLRGRALLANSPPRLSCSVPGNLAGRTEIYGAAMNKASPSAFGSPLSPAHLLPASPGLHRAHGQIQTPSGSLRCERN